MNMLVEFSLRLRKQHADPHEDENYREGAGERRIAKLLHFVRYKISGDHRADGRRNKYIPLNQFICRVVENRDRSRRGNHRH